MHIKILNDGKTGKSRPENKKEKELKAYSEIIFQ